VPVEECVRRWDEMLGSTGLVELHMLSGVGHDLMEVDGDGRDVVSPRYERTLVEWLSRRVLPPASGEPEPGTVGRRQHDELRALTGALSPLRGSDRAPCEPAG
jgi:hypothetical protein